MKNILKFEEWSSVSESVSESKGVSPVIFAHLKDCFDREGKNCSYEEACNYVSSKIDGWKLSKEDFEEAQKINESIENEDSILEGKMKEIEILSQESSSKEEFAEKLKAYVKEIGKADLADDKDFMEAMTDDFVPHKKED